VTFAIHCSFRKENAMNPNEIRLILAEAAGETMWVVMDHLRTALPGALPTQKKDDGSIATAIDFLADEAVEKALDNKLPTEATLRSEETSNARQVDEDVYDLGASVCVVDPVDGSTALTQAKSRLDLICIAKSGEEPSDFWCDDGNLPLFRSVSHGAYSVQIVYVEKKEIQAAAIAVPWGTVSTAAEPSGAARWGTVFSACREADADEWQLFVDGELVQPRYDTLPLGKIVVALGHPGKLEEGLSMSVPDLLDFARDGLGNASIQRLGAMAAECVRLLCGEVTIYVSGDEKVWDLWPGACLCRAAGLEVHIGRLKKEKKGHRSVVIWNPVQLEKLLGGADARRVVSSLEEMITNPVSL